MPPTAAQRQQIAAFSSITSVSEKLALKFLKNNGWKVDAAMDQYYQQQGQAAPSKPNSGLVNLFESFRDPKTDDVDSCGINGILKYFEQLGVDPENVSALVVLEIIQAAGMEEMTKTGFVDGWMANGASDSLPKQRQWIGEQIKSLITDPAYFKRLYRWTFGFAKENSQKALSLDTAIVYWGVLFSSPGPTLHISSINWLDEYTGYLREKWNKSVNKDMWNQTLEFFIKALVDESLSFWSEDGAWPGVIDDFVAHINQKRAASPEKMEVD